MALKMQLYMLGDFKIFSPNRDAFESEGQGGIPWTGLRVSSGHVIRTGNKVIILLNAGVVSFPSLTHLR